MSSLDDTLTAGITQGNIPAVSAMAATATETFYSGAFGHGITPESIFFIASMTKPIAATAAMQLVERGKVGLDEPASRYLPELANVQVLHGYFTTGKPVLRAPLKPITLRHLLTHTSGFAYDFFSQELFEYAKKNPGESLIPLLFEPGTRWQYGTSMDWAGKLVESISGQNLEQYMQANILQPLGMKDTSYIMTADKYDRLAGSYQKQPDGTMQENPRKLPRPPQNYSGGGGHYSTAADYTRFMQMILNRGRAGKEQILKPATVEMMSSNQIGNLNAGRLKSPRPEISVDVDLHPGAADKWGLGFLINSQAHEPGRSEGSLAWSGILNTFFWIDPGRGICATVMMQYLPFGDKDAVGLLQDFERAVYTNLPPAGKSSDKGARNR